MPIRPVALALLLAAGAIPAAAQGTGGGRPNVLWISTEDMSPRLGAYGDALARTPNIDRLAREGLRFTRAFTTSPVCAPSRSAIITGVHQTSLGTQHMRTTTDAPGLPGPYLAVPPVYVKALGEYLRAAGYYTTNNVKTDYQFAPIGNPRQPLTAWDESSRQAHWRNRPDRAQPFFAVFNFTETHESQVWADAPSNRGARLVTDPAAVTVPPYYPDTRAVREDLARHYDNIAEMDRRVGELLRQLQEDGLAESTVVFFWSDHGDGLPRAKRWLYDSGLHAPLLVRWPGRVAAGVTDDELVSFLDLAPTVLSVAGVDVPRHMQGRVLLGAARGPEPEHLFAARDRMDTDYDMVRAARGRRFKYIRNFLPQQPYVQLQAYGNRNATMQELLRLNAAGELRGPAALWMRTTRPPEELYDTQADPHEVANLADIPAYRDTLARMRSVLDGWLARYDDQGLLPEAEMVARMWPGGKQPVTATPLIHPRTATDVEGGVATALNAPAEVAIHCPTQGASIAWMTGDSASGKWKLYTGPIRVTTTTTIRARAVRYGYAESAEAKATFVVRQPTR